MTEQKARAVDTRETITQTQDGHTVQFVEASGTIAFVVNGRASDVVADDHALVHVAKEALQGVFSVRDPSGPSEVPVKVFDHIWLLRLAGVASALAATAMRAAA